MMCEDGGERKMSGTVTLVAVVVSILALEAAEVRLGFVAWDGFDGLGLAHAL